ncbi:hypothetical protein [Novosphingobium sp. 9]|uniref:hypothetical protein n=1 Tax=Novosphingobium sp. 9 TaxID=2025349 RepID=UPI0021B6A2A6|nr:hypothetical protein [Novosphingobium sp. 9]
MNRLAAVERSIVAALRGKKSGSFDDDAMLVFSILRNMASNQKIIIAPLDCAFLSEGEAIILAVLTMLQRKKDDYDFGMGADFMSWSLKACDFLDRQNKTLDWRNFSRLARIT